MITLGCHKNLCLILHPAKSFTMKDPVPVSLIDSPYIAFFLLPLSASGTKTQSSIRTEHLLFTLFHAFSDIHKRYLHKLTKYLLLIIFYIKFQIPLFFKKKLKFFYIFFKKVLTLAFTFDIVSLVARESKRIPKKCDMRKCRNWQTSKTKDLVSIALVWVQVPSSAFKE